MSDIIYYEQPLNERIRTFLRLEHLFNQVAYTLRGYSIWDSRATLHHLIDILDILGRTDFKMELLKEVERQHNTLKPLMAASGVNTEHLDTVLSELDSAETSLHAIAGQIGQNIREHELINILRQRHTTPGGTSHIDLPAYHFWLQKPAEERIEQLEQWLDSLKIVRQPVTLLLSIIRESTDAKHLVSTDGFYQQSLDNNTPIQLIRVGVKKETDCYAEISAGKHRLTVRFLQPRPDKRPLQIDHQLEFYLNCCSL